LGAEDSTTFAAFCCTRLRSIFLHAEVPSTCLAEWLKERYLKQFDMHLYRHGLLSYTDLFSLNGQQSRDYWLKYIKSLFMCSHLMYWAVLSDDDELALFVPSTINPLTENDVCTTLLPAS